MKHNKKFKKIPLAKISKNAAFYYQITNKYLIDEILSTYNPLEKELQENQEIYTLRVPKPRHWTLDFFFTKILRKSSRLWKPYANHYTNHKFKLKEGILSILVQKNLTKDTNVFYYTTANQILALQDLGLTKSQALSSKVIEAIGRYNLIIEERRIKSNIVTNKTILKTFITTSAQKNIRLLQPIERLICDYSDISAKGYSEKVVETLTEYADCLQEKIDTLKKLVETQPHVIHNDVSLLKKLDLNPELLKLFIKYNNQFIFDLISQYESKLRYCKQFLASFGNHTLSPESVSYNLQSFLIYELNEIVRGSVALNESITTSSKDSLLRGKLHDYLVDADTTIREYLFDPLHPITREHQSDYRLDEETEYGENKVLYQSRVHAGHSKQEQERLLIGITALNDLKTKQINSQKPVTVKSAGWNNYSTRTKNQKLKRLAAWVITEIVHAPLSLLNMLVTSFTGKAPVARWMYQIEKFITDKFELEENYDHPFFHFASLLGGNNLYTSTLIGKMVNNVLHEFTSIIVQSPKLIYEKILQQFSYLKKDFMTGFWRKFLKSKNVEVSKENEFDEQNSEIFAHLQQLIETAKDLNHCDREQLFAEDLIYASPKEPLDPYIPNDIFSSCITAITTFIKFFQNDVIQKHPYLGFIAAIAYACGGAAVMAPATLKLILAKAGLSAQQANLMVSLLQDIGKPLAKGSQSQAIASGFTLAQAMGASMNTLAQGFDSALLELINEIRKEPLIYLAGISIAYGCGHMITDVINVPGFSEYLRNDMGTFPALCKTMFGAKLGLISMETAIPEDEIHDSILATFLSDVAKNLMIGVRLALSIVSLSKQPWIDLGHQLIRGGAIILNAANKITVTASQMLMQLPKNFLEVITITYANIAKAGSNVFSLFSPKQNQEVATIKPLLRVKDKLLHVGHKFTFFMRSKSSRKLEHFYSKAVKELDHLDKDNSNQYLEILQKLKVAEVGNYFYCEDIIAESEMFEPPIESIIINSPKKSVTFNPAKITTDSILLDYSHSAYTL